MAIQFDDVVKKKIASGEALGRDPDTGDVTGLEPGTDVDPVEVVTDPAAQAALSGAFAPLTHLTDDEAHDATDITVGDVFHSDFGVPDVSAALVGLDDKIEASARLVAALTDTSRVLAWDDFQRPDQTGLGTAPSGHVWSGSTANISGGRTVRASNGLATVEVGTPQVTIDLTGGFTNATNSRWVGACLVADASNFISVRIQHHSDTLMVVIQKVIGGTSTQVGSSSFTCGGAGADDSLRLKASFFITPTRIDVHALAVDTGQAMTGSITDAGEVATLEAATKVGFDMQNSGPVCTRFVVLDGRL